MPFVKVGEHGQVVIPKKVRAELDLKEGDVLEVTKVNPDDILTPEERALVLKGEEQLRRGDSVTLEELEHDLDRQTRKAGTEAAEKASS